MQLSIAIAVRITGFALLILLQGLPARAVDINFGFLAGFSGPTQPLAEVLADGMQLAFSHVNDQGGLHGGKNAVQVRANSQCSDKSGAIKAAEHLIGKEAVVGIVGGLCSGATLAAAQGFSIPTGTPMITPASLSPAITGLLDNDLLYRTVSTNTKRINMLAAIIEEEALQHLAVVHTTRPQTLNRLEKFTELLDGERPFDIATYAFSPDSEISVELEWQTGDGGDLVILDDLRSNPPLLDFLKQAAGLATVRHIYIDGEVDRQALLTSIEPSDHPKITLVTAHTSAERGYEKFTGFAQLAGLDPQTPFLTNTYDAAFLLALAVELQHADRSLTPSEAIRAAANPPGETILPGEWGKALRLIASGTDIDYEGASGPIEFDEHGDLIPTYTKATIVDGNIQILEILN